MTEEKQNDTKRVKGKFLGAVQVNEGTNNEGKAWQKMKSTFNVEDKDWNFNYFMPWTKKDGTEKKGINASTLEIGKFYNLLYSEYQTEEMDWPAKTIICVFESKSQSPDAPKEEEVSMDEAVKQVIDPKPLAGVEQKDVIEEAVEVLAEKELADMATQYFTSVDKALWTENHFIGTLYRTMQPEHCIPLIRLFNEKKS